MDLIIGVASSLVAAIIILLLGRATGLITLTLRRRIVNRDLQSRLQKAGIVNLFTRRADYARYRRIANVGEYLATATKSVELVGYWMAQGNEIESVAAKLARILEQRPDFVLKIALIDPRSDIVRGLAKHMGFDDEKEVRDRIRSTLRNLKRARDSLSTPARNRFTLVVYDSIPNASVIILDGDEPSGRIQVDFKPYRLDRAQSWGFEFSGPGTALYDKHLSYRGVFDGAITVDDSIVQDNRAT